MKYFVACALLVPFVTSADVVISEVMYDLENGSDGGREWIEIHNTGPEAISLANWTLFENGTNHKISGDAAVQSGAYAVLADNPAKFKMDWPSYTGLLFDSAFSLSNEGETIVMRDSSGRDVSSAVFSNGIGGNGTGDSLQRDGSGAFGAGMPTPGTGIPAGGLVRSPTKAKSSKTGKVAKEKFVASPADIRGEVPIASQAALVLPSTATTSLLPWLCGVFLLGGIGTTGIVWARHLKKDEWEIIEEIA